MSLLTDTDIARLCDPEQTGEDDLLSISPFSEESLTPVGYDLRVGSPYAISNASGLYELPEHQSLEIRPNSTALITTLESVRMPRSRTVAGLIESKVTKVSLGLSHISTTVDPDWRGNLLIAIHNHSREKVSLKYGETFCTMVLLATNSPSRKECDKDPGRATVFLKKFDAETKKSESKRRLKTFIPPLIVVGSAAVGYTLFGNAIGFSAFVVAGVALSQYVAEKLR